MPKLDRRFFGESSTPPVSPARALHSEYEARLLSPARHLNSPKRLSRSSSVGSIGEGTIKATPRTPKSGNQNIYSDRFIPSRSGSQLDTGFCLIDAMPRKRSNSMSTMNSNTSNATTDTSKENSSTFSMLLRNELLGVDVPSPRSDQSENKPEFLSSPARNLFRFKTPVQSMYDEVKRPLTFSPVGSISQRLLSSPRETTRKIPKMPYKVLDAPNLQDDFYLNLVDWSSSNTLAVGLGASVYLWSAHTSKVTKLCDLTTAGDSVTSVAWTQMGTQLSVGTNSGEVQLWDIKSGKKIRTMGGHSLRVGTMAWNAHILASGGRDRHIYQRDVRCPESYVHKLIGHRQEVCGLRWSPDEQQLASGGNDNKLFIWSAHSANPISRFTDHTAAVKAIAWSPHQHGLLASGGGTADRCIRFWNTLTGTALNCIDTGSQVCNLIWSTNVNEVVSTHGYSLNQIIVWRYPSMTKIATLTGHTSRVLYLAMSPDGQTIVTGAGDETLRFWNAFPGAKNKDGSRLGTSLLLPGGETIR